MHDSLDELLTIGTIGLRARLTWSPRSPGVVVVLQQSSRLSRGGVALINVLRERSRSCMRLGLLARGERAFDTGLDEPEFLSERVVDGLAWLRSQSYAQRSRIGLFGEGLGAVIAIRVAATHPTMVDAVVLRNAHRHFEGEIASVRAATLLIASEHDVQAIANNRRAISELHCTKRLEVLATAPSESPDHPAVEMASNLAAGWFEMHLGNDRRP